MAVISVQSGVGQSLVFTVTGTQTTAYAEAFSQFASTATTFTSLDNVAAQARANFGPALDTTTLYTFDQIGGSALAVGGYLLDEASGASTIYGSGVGDTVLFAGVNQSGTYVDNGGSDQIIFVSGDNTYDGVNATDGSTDTIVAGSGYDTINTGTNDAIVDSGTGKADITLNDTGSTGTYNDLVYLDDGQSTVYADGLYDGVVANAAGQTLIGGTVTGALNVYVLNTSELASTAAGNDLVVAGAATTAILDDTSSNTIFGGSGVLYAAVGTSVTSASIVGGTGGNYIYGADGSTLTFYASTTDTAPNVLVGNAGSETLNGAASDGNLLFFAGQAPDAVGSVGAATYNESLVGGSGNDSFVSGSGFETMVGGAGNNLFDISAQDSTVGGASITIADFGASAGNEYEFSGFSGNPVVSETDGSNGVTLTLTDNTTVIFLGETAAGLNGHLI
jgi:hypothetical protein